MVGQMVKKNLMIIMENSLDGIQTVKVNNMVFVVIMQIFHLLVQQVQITKKNNGVTDTSRPIYSITGYTPAKGTYYNVTWKSKDLSKGIEYTHTGRLVITQIDTNRPNHS